MSDKSETDIESFPSQLLDGSISEKCNFINNFIIDHTTMVDAKEDLLWKLESMSDTPIVSLMGPTRIGKTTLLNIVERILLKKYKDGMDKDPGFNPILRQAVTTLDSRPFDFKDHYIRGLLIAGEPLVSKTRIYDESRINQNGSPISPVVFESNTTRSYRYRLESTLIHRRTKVYIIDEAPDMLKLASRSKEKDVLDVLKSLGENTGTKILLAGTYALVNMLNKSGQLAARSSIPTHFRRYLHRSQSKKDGDDFKGILQIYENILPLPTRPDFVSLYDFMYEKTLGCIGILKAWIVKSYEEADAKKLNTVDKKLLSKNAPTTAAVLKIIEEIKVGENFILGENSSKIWVELGIDPSAKDKKEKQTKKKVRSKVKPFHRKPERDKVGVKRQIS